MIQNTKRGTKRQLNMTLHLDYHKEELSSAQVEYYNRAKEKIKDLKETVADWIQAEGEVISRISDDCFVLQRNCTPPPSPPPAATIGSPVTSDVPVIPVAVHKAAVPQAVTAVSCSPAVLQTTLPQQASAVGGQIVTNAVRSPATSYQLVMDSRLGLVVGAVTSASATVETSCFVTTASTSTVKTVVSSSVMTPIPVSAFKNTSLPNSVVVSQTASPSSQNPSMLNSTRMPTPPVVNLHSAPRYPVAPCTVTQNSTDAVKSVTSAGVVPRGTVPARGMRYTARNSSPTPRARYSHPMPAIRNPIQGAPIRQYQGRVMTIRNRLPHPMTVSPRLTTQSPTPVVDISNEKNRRKTSAQTTSVSDTPVVDLTSDDTPTQTVADTREVTFSKLIGKTYPSLVVVARPCLRIKEFSASELNEDRTQLDITVKDIVLRPESELTEWLIQKGLIPSDQVCRTHISPSGKNIHLKLGIYSDPSKFSYSGGYVWISECCPERFVSVFCGSIFEGSPHSPVVLLKLIYHWIVQTSIQNVVQWVGVDNLYVKGFYTHLRTICNTAIAEKFEKMGGLNKKIEVGVISLGTASKNGRTRQVKVEVLGVMDFEAKIIRLRAIEPVLDGEDSYRRRFLKILEPVGQWVDKDSVILTDLTVDKTTLQSFGFKTIYQGTLSEDGSDKKYNNEHVMDYLRNYIPKIFQNTLSLLSRPLIQQFLDELVWRECWGYTPNKAFEAMLTHISELVKIDSDDSLVTQLSKIAQDPFKCWSYKSLSSSPVTSLGVVYPEKSIQMDNLSSEPSPSNSLASNDIEPIGNCPPTDNCGPISSIDMLPESIRMIDSTKGKSVPAKRRRKRSNQSPELSLPEPKRQAATSPHPEELVQLESYYYGQLAGNSGIIESEYTVDGAIECSYCLGKFENNIALQKHLINHAQSENQFPSNVSNEMCKYCLKLFNRSGPSDMQIVALSVHLEEVHFKNSKNLVCRICEEKFRTRLNLISHMHTTHSAVEMPYECDICKYRSSMHSDVVDHFYDVHKNSEKLQCPYCLKTVAFAAKGKRISPNIYFFINHIQKHQRKSLVRKCHRCVLCFVHKGILQEHQTKDHVSFALCEKVMPCFNVNGMDMMMPKPSPGYNIPLFAQKKTEKDPTFKNLYTSKYYTNLKIIGVDDHAICNECEGFLLQENHFPGEMSCLYCPFSSCCIKSMSDHVFIFHHESTKNKPQFIIGRKIILAKPMYCICGFSSNSGNRLAKHLALCGKKSAYSRPYSQKIVTLPSASFPPLVTLDDTDNASEDPSDRWLKAFVPSRKDDSDACRNSADKVAETQAKFEGSSGPLSVLNILGLMQKPSDQRTLVEKQSKNSGSKADPISDDKILPSLEH